MAEEKDEVIELKAKACDLFTQDIRLKNALQHNTQELQQTLNEIEHLEKD